MKKYMLSVAALAAVAFFGVKPVSAETYYVEPSVFYAGISGDYDRTWGQGITVGCSVGSEGSSAIELEVDTMKSTYKGKALIPDGSLRFTPILATYKCYWAMGSSTAVYLGVSAGTTIEKGYWRYYYGYSVSKTSCAGTFGGQIGVVQQLTKNTGITCGVKVLGVGSTSRVSSGSLTLVNLGYRVCF